MRGVRCSKHGVLTKFGSKTSAEGISRGRVRETSITRGETLPPDFTGKRFGNSYVLHLALSSDIRLLIVMLNMMVFVSRDSVPRPRRAEIHCIA